MIDELRVPLDAAIDGQSFPLPGTDFFMLESAPDGADVGVRIGGPSSPRIPFSPGRAFSSCVPFDRVVIDAAGVGGELVFLYGAGVEMVDAAAAAEASDLVAGQFNATPLAVSDGATVPLATDNAGRLFTRMADRLQADLDSIRTKGLPPASDSIAEAAAGATHTAQVESSGRPNVTAWGEAGAAVDWELQGSVDGGLNWFVIDASPGATDYLFNGAVGVADLRLVVDASLNGPLALTAHLSAMAG